MINTVRDPDQVCRIGQVFGDLRMVGDLARQYEAKQGDLLTCP